MSRQSAFVALLACIALLRCDATPLSDLLKAKRGSVLQQAPVPAPPAVNCEFPSVTITKPGPREVHFSHTRIDFEIMIEYPESCPINEEEILAISVFDTRFERFRPRPPHTLGVLAEPVSGFDRFGSGLNVFNMQRVLVYNSTITQTQDGTMVRAQSSFE